MNIYTVISGGYGDTILSYFHDGCDVGYFKALKERGHGTRVELWNHHGDEGKRLMSMNPYIDHVELHQDLPFNPYQRSARFLEPSWVHMRETIERGAKWERPKFYLSRDEEITAHNIMPPYVAVHTFSNPDNEKRGIPTGIANTIVDALLDAGHTVVLLGGGPDKDTKNWRWSNNCHSMIGCYSLRLQAYMASRATKFIGSLSVYNCVALEFKVPSLLFAPPTHNRNADTRRLINEYTFDIFSMIKQNHAHVLYWDDMPKDLTKTVQDFAR